METTIAEVGSRPIDDAKAMEVIESDVNSLFFRTERTFLQGLQGSQGFQGPRVQDDIVDSTNQTVSLSTVSCELLNFLITSSYCTRTFAISPNISIT